MFISVSTFIILLIITSVIKNQTREIEKKIYKISETINIKEKDLSETQFDFAYLTSPSMIQQKIFRYSTVFSFRVLKNIFKYS